MTIIIIIIVRFKGSSDGRGGSDAGSGATAALGGELKWLTSSLNTLDNRVLDQSKVANILTIFA